MVSSVTSVSANAVDMNSKRIIIVLNICAMNLIFLWDSAVHAIEIPPAIERLYEFAPEAEWLTVTSNILQEFNLDQHGLNVSLTSASEELDATRVSIVVFDSDLMPPNEISLFKYNCAFVSRINVIACDVRMIEGIIEDYDYHETEWVKENNNGVIVERGVGPASEEKIWEKRKLLLAWILSHELGHAAAKHGGTFFFSPEKASQNAFRDNTVPERVNRCHKRELEADKYLVQILGIDRVDKEFYGFLYDLVNREIQRSACPDKSLAGYCENIYPGTGMVFGTEPVEATSTKTHPAFLIRILDLVALVGPPNDILTYQAEQFRDNGITLREAYYRVGGNC